jgi:hypothetical protein
MGRRERVARRATEDQVGAGAAGAADVVGEDHAQRLRERHLAHTRRRLRLPLACLVIPAVLDADRADAVAVEAADVRNPERAQLAAAEAGVERGCPQRAIVVRERL